MKRGFTLVELLVVITIIVILLALLVPALSEGVYQARLMQCGTNQRNVGNGMIQYGIDHKREYPHRGLPRTTQQFAIGTQVLVHPVEGFETPGDYDLRPALASFIDINTYLLDVMVEPVDLAIRSTSQVAEDYILASFHMWHGWKYEGQDEDLRMARLDDRWSWEGRSYRVLFNDMDNIWNSGNGVTCSHPDRGIGGRLANIYGTRNTFGFGAMYITGSYWENANSKGRNPVDLNFTYDDGSVRRLGKVAYQNDERVVRVPSNSRGSAGTGTLQVPK